MTRRSAALLAIATMWGAGCTVHQTLAPELTGPSDFAISLRVTATPDRINRDGVSQSAIVVAAFNAAGQPLSGLALRIDMAVGDVLQDFGTLSARNLVTGSDGRAATVYTAPPAPPAGSGGTMSSVTIVAIPVGSNAQVSSANGGSRADILLTPVGVILPPADTPTAAFTVTPTPVNLNSSVTFDASASCGGSVSGGLCASASKITTDSWTFGDGTTGIGKTVNHAFEGVGTFSVTLTVTNDRGVSASTTQTVPVAALALPTASFVFSPSAPNAGDLVVFNAAASTAASGHAIVSYNWNFGDGEPSESGVLVNHRFQRGGGATAINYVVVLTVTDDTGRKATTTQPVPVK
jgi:PKD repeat protein